MLWCAMQNLMLNYEKVIFLIKILFQYYDLCTFTEWNVLVKLTFRIYFFSFTENKENASTFKMPGLRSA